MIGEDVASSTPQMRIVTRKDSAQINFRGRGTRVPSEGEQESTRRLRQCPQGTTIYTHVRQSWKARDGFTPSMACANLTVTATTAALTEDEHGVAASPYGDQL